MRTLQEIGDGPAQRNVFTGGPVELFETAGRLQASVLIQQGIYPWSKMVDIGCGCLRGGYWMIHFLNAGCYYGIEPNAEMVKTGLKEIVEPEILAAKQPTIDNNAIFDTSVFGVKFDVFFCRSIWTHTSKGQIEIMLDNFLRDSTPHAFFLTSYHPAVWPWEDYRGAEHRGRSHLSSIPAIVKHRYSWIENACRERGLSVVELPDGVLSGQKWLKVSRRSSD